eukprot:661778-Rhodomonas_salina.1
MIQSTNLDRNSYSFLILEIVIRGGSHGLVTFVSICFGVIPANNIFVSGPLPFVAIVDGIPRARYPGYPGTGYPGINTGSASACESDDCHGMFTNPAI